MKSRMETTHELRIFCADKPRLFSVLAAVGVDTYVEGVVDGLDLDASYDDAEIERQFACLDDSPVSIYRFEWEALVALGAYVQAELGEAARLELDQMPTADWRDRWRDSFLPIVTQKFVVFPPWRQDARSLAEHSLEIEPAMAFGTGQHATTQLCLRALENFPPRELLDVGTGSGILAIAAGKLGAGRVKGTDIDIEAIRAAEANAALNGQVIVWEMRPGVASTEGTYETVVANIIARVLIDCRQDLERVSGGKLFLSGLLIDDEALVLEHFRWPVFHREEIDGWLCLGFKRP